MILDDKLLHKLWTKSTGLDDYDDTEWQELEAQLHKLMRDLDEANQEIAYLRQRVIETEILLRNEYKKKR